MEGLVIALAYVSVVSIVFLAVIALLGVLAIISGQPEVTGMILQVLRDLVHLVWQ